ncbi:MAG: ABC transporter permease [Chloroflexota bacterium]
MTDRSVSNGHLVIAFLRRDWQYETSYRGMMILQMFGIVGSLIIFYAIGLLVDPDATSLQQYGGEYFPFALIGLAVSDFFNVGLRSFSNRLRLAQTTGTLEAMLTTRTPGHVIIGLAGIWDFLVATVRLVVAVLIGAIFLDVRFDVSPVPLILTALLSLICFAALGLLAAALILVIKRGDAVAAFGNIFASVFAGALFPIDLLPDGIRWIAYVLPLHYALDGLRRSALVGASFGQLQGNLIVLGLAALLLVPLAIFALDRAIQWCREDGTLGMY